jgi:hypothetical protein
VKTAAPSLVVSRTLTVVTLLRGGKLHSETALEASRKNLFHRLGIKFFKEFATSLHWQPNSYDVRNYLGGQKVSGEIWLHSENYFFKLSQDFRKDEGSGESALYARRCFGLKDFGANSQPYWMPTELLENVTGARDWFLDLRQTISQTMLAATGEE